MGTERNGLMRRYFFRMIAGLMALLLGAGCAIGAAEEDESMKHIASYQEKYRSQYHFSPATGWIGDPDGYVLYQGKYHLFWWGKATSEDLVHFDQKTIGDTFATIGDPGLGDYFTGSAVIDKENSAGFGENAMVAIYTSPTRMQQQSISYSTDDTFDSLYYYEGNPVLVHEELSDFRDPTVFWDAAHQRWAMVIALPTRQSVAFYSSPDLKEWTYHSEFGQMGARGKDWECPDLFKMTADDGTEKWVLVVSVSPNQEQYFIGEFDGERFLPDPEVTDYLQKGIGLEGEIFCDFEGGSFGDWQVTGDAFGVSPADASALSGIGQGVLLSDARATGSLVSPEFVIEKNAINFLLCTSAVTEKACIRLLIDGEPVRTASPGGDFILRWYGWDVQEYIGRTARIEILDLDERTRIAVDHIMFSDSLRNNGREHAFFVDNGADFYASRTFRDYDGTMTDTIWLGWMGNWTYNNKLPAISVTGYNAQRGALSIARSLHLNRRDGFYRLEQRPIAQLQSLRGAENSLPLQTLPQGVHALSGFAPSANVYELDVVFTPESDNDVFGLNLLSGDGKSLPIRYHAATQCLTVDRTHCAGEKISDFSCQMSSVLPLRDGCLRLQIFVDKRSVEIFVNGGEQVFTLLTFPGENQLGIETFSQTGGTKMALRGWELSSIWPGHIQLMPRQMESTDDSTIYTGEYCYLEKQRRCNNRDCHEITEGSLTAAFTGTAIDWYTLLSKDCGKVDIYIDGVLDRQGLDLYAVMPDRRKVYSKTDLTPGPHTITIQTTGQKNENATGTKFNHDTFVYLPLE